MAGVINPVSYKSLAPGTDLNTSINAGIYKLSGGYSNAPFSQTWGWLDVRPTGDGRTSQMIYDLSGSKSGIYFRETYDGTWKRIDNFGYNSLKELAGGVVSEISPLTYLGYFNNETPYDSILKSGYGFSTPDDGSGILGHFIIMVYASSKAVIKIGISGNCKIRASDLNGEWSEWKLL